MTRLGPIAVGMLIFTAVLWHPALARAADAPSCRRLTLYSSLPLTTEPDGRVSVPITVQDKNYSFLVDTGGAVATIGWDQAEEVGLKKRSGDAYAGVGGRYSDTYILADRVSLGGMTGHDLALWVEPRSGMDFDGTLSPDMLKHFDVDLDFAHSKMNLFSQDHCPGKVVYWTQGDAVTIPMRVGSSAHIRVPVTVDGKSITAIVDTGAVSSIMSMHAASFLGITEDAPSLKLKTSAGYRKRTRLYTYPFKTLQMGEVTVSNPRILIGSNEFMGDFRSDMILGVGILRQLHLYIAYKEEKFYITPAGAN